MGVKDPHRNLEAWRKAMDLVVDIYKVTETFPKQEQYGLTSQMRRASVSVPSNIAEGAVGRTTNHFVNYLSISIGSLSELDTQTELAYRLDFLNKSDFETICSQIDRCKALIYGLKYSLLKKEK
jgi:four helix bundle protein